MEQDSKQLITQADAAIKAGNFERAEQLYQSLLEQQPESATAYFALGTMAMQKNKFQSAFEHLKRAAELEPEAVDIAFNFAHCLVQVGNRIGALIQLQRATRYCKDDPVFCSRIAEMLQQLGEPAAAIELLGRLQALTPQDQIILAKANGRMSNWREGVNILKRLNDAAPDDPVVANELAKAAGKLRDYPTAISAFERYLRLVRPTANDYLRFADLLLIAQSSDRCEQALDRALELGEDGPEVYVLKARVARLNADYAEANAALDKALDRMPNHGQAWSIRAELANDDQLSMHIDGLEIELNKPEKISSLNAHHQALLHFALGDMQDRNQNYAAAASSFENANQVQYQHLQAIKGIYSPEQIEKQVDRLIADFHQDVFDQANASIEAQSVEIQPIFIVGMPRSGTTLVERILGQNKDVFNAGEQEAMEYVAADLRQQTRSGKLPEPMKITPQQWAQLRETYLEKLPEISKPIFTDKLPHNFRQVGIILKLFPDARVIQMHRSIQDVCLSIYSHAFAAGHNYANRWQDLKHFHTETERLMKHWSSLHSSQILDLKYENLVQNPDYYARQLVEFCGFKWNESYLDFHQSTNKSFTFSEMQVRQPIASKRVDRWRNYAEFIPELSGE